MSESNITKDVIDGYGTIIRVPSGVEDQEDQIIWVPEKEITQSYVPGRDWEAAGNQVISERDYQNQMWHAFDDMGYSPTAMGVRKAEADLDAARRARRSIPTDDSARYMPRSSTPSADPLPSLPGRFAPEAGVGSIIGGIGSIIRDLFGAGTSSGGEAINTLQADRNRDIETANARVTRAQNALTNALDLYAQRPRTPYVSTERPTWSSNPSLAEAANQSIDTTQLSDADWLEYGSANLDLLAEGLDTPEELKQHWETTGKNEEGRNFTNPDWDYQRYLINNPDLLGAGLKTNQQALQHYANHGWNEGEGGRDYRTDNFNEDLYASNYADLDEHNIDTEDKLSQHYIDHGFGEGRVDIPLETLQNYGISNPDVHNAWTADINPDIVNYYANHYNQHGRFEGRTSDSSFNPQNYLINNPDVLATMGSNPAAARDHYITHGQAEGRDYTTDNFDETTYANRYGDLQEA